MIQKDKLTGSKKQKGERESRVSLMLRVTLHTFACLSLSLTATAASIPLSLSSFWRFFFFFFSNKCAPQRMKLYVCNLSVTRLSCVGSKALTGNEIHRPTEGSLNEILLYYSRWSKKGLQREREKCFSSLFLPVLVFLSDTGNRILTLSDIKNSLSICSISLLQSRRSIIGEKKHRIDLRLSNLHMSLRVRLLQG